MDREKENELIMVAARWEAICDILDGEEASGFMLSFPEVQRVADLCSTNTKKACTDCETYKQYCAGCTRQAGKSLG